MSPYNACVVVIGLFVLVSVVGGLFLALTTGLEWGRLLLLVLLIIVLLTGIAATRHRGHQF